MMQARGGEVKKKLRRERSTGSEEERHGTMGLGEGASEKKVAQPVVQDAEEHP
jgi:hypothetical protein